MNFEINEPPTSLRLKFDSCPFIPPEQTDVEEEAEKSGLPYAEQNPMAGVIAAIRKARDASRK